MVQRNQKRETAAEKNVQAGRQRQAGRQSRKSVQCRTKTAQKRSSRNPGIQQKRSMTQQVVAGAGASSGRNVKVTGRQRQAETPTRKREVGEKDGSAGET